jgi:ribosome recycling factor
VINHLNNEYLRIRSGRVTLNILDPVKVQAYGEMMNLNQVANLQIVDARQILIKPYDRSQNNDIAKAILASNININPQVNPDGIRLIFPAQTEENRKISVKKCKELLENSKQSLRDIRKIVQGKYKNINEISEDQIRYFEDELNKVTRFYNSKLEDIFIKKEQELMKI